MDRVVDMGFAHVYFLIGSRSRFPLLELALCFSNRTSLSPPDHAERNVEGRNLSANDIVSSTAMEAIGNGRLR